jgi:hypothetical protein
MSHMAVRQVHHNGKDYEVVAGLQPNGKYFSVITPPGRAIRQPDKQTTVNGVTSTTLGRPVEFDTEEAALDAGEDNIKKGMIPD